MDVSAPGKVSPVTVPPPTVWGHVSMWDFLTQSDLGTYFNGQPSKQ